jgi:hypothetical protein
MKSKSTIDRIKTIQRRLGLDADGIIGPDTLTAIENELFNVTGEMLETFSLVISREGLDQLINHEVVSKSYYNRLLKKPVWPGGGSGVTIGIGYDLGYNRESQIEADWSGKVSDRELKKLTDVSGLKGEAASDVLKRLKSIEIDFDAASDVFYQSTLIRYAQMTRKTFDGVEALFPDAQSALLSLVYNRGTSMSGAKRREMAAIKTLVTQQDYVGIANKITEMKRLWEGKGLDGLLKRRDDEARLVLNANRRYIESNLIRL